MFADSMDSSQKRTAAEDAFQPPEKRQKKQWRVPRQHDNRPSQSKSIQPGDSGIWATCDKGRESKCIGELRDLFAEYGEALNGNVESQSIADGAPTVSDIEGDIEAEISDLRQSKDTQLFTPLRVDVQCGEQRNES